MAACAHEDVRGIQEYIKDGTTLHFEYYSDKTDDHVGLKVIRLEDLHQQKLSDHEILKILIQEHTLPQELR